MHRYSTSTTEGKSVTIDQWAIVSLSSIRNRCHRDLCSLRGFVHNFFSEDCVYLLVTILPHGVIIKKEEISRLYSTVFFLCKEYLCFVVRCDKYRQSVKGGIQNIKSVYSLSRPDHLFPCLVWGIREIFSRTLASASSPALMPHLNSFKFRLDHSTWHGNSWGDRNSCSVFQRHTVLCLWACYMYGSKLWI